MSQEKIDKRKAEKTNRKKQLAKKKQKTNQEEFQHIQKEKILPIAITKGP